MAIYQVKWISMPFTGTTYAGAVAGIMPVPAEVVPVDRPPGEQWQIQFAEGPKMKVWHSPPYDREPDEQNELSAFAELNIPASALTMPNLADMSSRLSWCEIEPAQMSAGPSGGEMQQFQTERFQGYISQYYQT